MVFIVTIFLIPLSFLALHIYRDIRGKQRNKRGSCYACGAEMMNAETVQHHKGGAFKYCIKCAAKSRLYHTIGLWLMGVATIGLVVVALLN